jgi:uncharacterized protein
MAGERGHGMDLRNETAVNVVGLLKEPVGSTRTYHLALDRFGLDEEAVAQGVRGEVKLTRLRDGVMATARAAGEVALECARCLRPYEQPFEAAFTEEYRQTVDVRTGVGLGAEVEDDEESSAIDENHELDLGEVLRQEILVALPMRPDCGEECPGPDQVESGADDEPIDARLAALGRLLEDEPA